MKCNESVKSPCGLAVGKERLQNVAVSRKCGDLDVTGVVRETVKGGGVGGGVEIFSSYRSETRQNA